MNHKIVLFIGTGQIDKAILNKIMLNNPMKVIIHNLTEEESNFVCAKYKEMYPNIEFISSYGNRFMPYNLKDLNNRNLYDKSEDIINYFYCEINQSILEKSIIVTLIKKI